MHEIMVFTMTYRPDDNYLLAAFGLSGLGTLIAVQLFCCFTMLSAGVGLLVAIIGTLSGRFKDEQLDLVNALFICDAVGLMGYFAGAAFVDFWTAGDDFEGPTEAGSFPLFCLSGVLLAARLVVTPFTSFPPGRQKLILAFGALCIGLVMVSVIAHYAAGAGPEKLSELHQKFVFDCHQQTSGSMCG